MICTSPGKKKPQKKSSASLKNAQVHAVGPFQSLASGNTAPIQWIKEHLGNLLQRLSSYDLSNLIEYTISKIKDITRPKSNIDDVNNKSLCDTTAKIELGDEKINNEFAARKYSKFRYNHKAASSLILYIYIHFFSKSV